MLKQYIVACLNSSGQPMMEVYDTIQDAVEQHGLFTFEAGHAVMQVINASEDDISVEEIYCVSQAYEEEAETLEAEVAAAVQSHQTPYAEEAGLRGGFLPESEQVSSGRGGFLPEPNNHRYHW